MKLADPFARQQLLIRDGAADVTGQASFVSSSPAIARVIHQREGSSTPVTIGAKSLPPGVHFQPTTIPSDSRGAFVLSADENAADFTGSIDLVASYESSGQKIERPVRS